MVGFAVLVVVVGYDQVIQSLFNSWFKWPNGHIDSDSARTARLLLATRGDLFAAAAAVLASILAARASLGDGSLKPYLAILIAGVIPPTVLVSFSRWGQDGTFGDVERVPPVAVVTMAAPLLAMAAVRVFCPAWLYGE